MTDKPVTLAQPRVRATQPKVWRSLAIGAAVTLAAAPAFANGRMSLEPSKEFGAGMGAKLWTVQAQGGEGGEGGEGGGAVATGDETVDLLTNLMQIEGHLTTGFTLWAAGDAENGQAHMGHPYAEVYGAIEDKLKELGVAPFEEPLEELVAAAAAGKPQADLDGFRQEIQAGIDAARKAADDGEIKDVFLAIQALLHKAGDEFGEGVQGGKVVELHEYQDAWGFVQAAKAQAGVLAKSADPVVKAAGEKTLQALAELDETLPSVTPEGSIAGDATWFQGAAAKVELAASRVK